MKFDLGLFLDVLLPSLSILISLFIGIYTVNRRVENENKESHKPYLVVYDISVLPNFHRTNYFLTFFGRNYLKKYGKAKESELLIKDEEKDFFISLCLKNIGYGVASDIRFYNLLTGNEIVGTQESNKDINQKLFTTLDIATDQKKEVPVKILSYIIEDEGIVLEDHNRILCVYKDLNDHIYDAIITVNMKTPKTFDYFIYQRTSRSYKKWIRENKKEYKKILKEYNTEKKG